MTARELFDDGRLSEAIKVQKAAVGKRPEDASARLLLCELLAFAGRFPEVSEELDRFPNPDAAFREYLDGWREIVRADAARHAGGPAAYLMAPPQHVELLAAAIRRPDTDLADQAMEAMPVLEGHIDGRAFEGCRDSDDSLVGELEFFADGESIRVPWDHLRKMRLAPVECLRDQLYRPATLTLTDGRAVNGFVPTNYVMGTDDPEDLRCGLGTDYGEVAHGMRGIGAKMLLLGEEELTLTEFTQLELRPAR